MESEWIKRRFDRYAEKEKSDRLMQQWQSNAVAMYPARFGALKKQVSDDVQFYNQLFAHRDACKAHFKNDNPDQFLVTCGRGAVEVGKAGATIISVVYSPEGSEENVYETLEVAPDPSQNGQIGYRNSTGGFLTEVSASEHILSRILR